MWRGWRIVLVLLVGLYLVPVWAFRYFPSVDGPSHMLNAQILKEFHNPRFDYPRYYVLNLQPKPNWFEHFWLAGWQYVVSPLVAEKLLLTLYIVLMSLSLWYLMRAAGHRHPGYLMLGLPFLLNCPVFLGFYNFCMAMPLMFFALGLWWGGRNRMTWRRGVGLAALLIVTYFCHVLPFALACASIGAMAVAYYRRRWRAMVISLLPLAPAALLALFYSLTGHLAQQPALSGGWREFPRLLTRMFISGLVSFDIVTNAILAAAVVAVVLAAAGLGLAWQVRRRRRGEGPLLESRDWFLVPFGVMLVLFFVLPDAMGNQASWINVRMALLSGLLILPWVNEDIWPRARRAVLAAALVMTLVSWGYYTRQIQLFQPQLLQYISAADMIGPNEVILPLLLADNGREDRRHAVRAYPLLHASEYYCLGNGNINLDNYEACYDIFPVNFRPDPPPNAVKLARRPEWNNFAAASHYAQWVIAYGDDPAVLDRVAQYYDLVRQDGPLRVYRSKSFPLARSQ